MRKKSPMIEQNDMECELLGITDNNNYTHSEITWDMLIDMMKSAGDTLEVTDEGEDIRVKGFFVVPAEEAKE